jgi:hypothetical protein
MATLQTLGPFHNAPEVRLLPSTGITRLHRYYGPVRLPKRPGLSLAGVRLVCDHRLGSPVLRLRSVQTCRRHYPGGTVKRVVARCPSRCQPSPFEAGSAPAITLSRPAQRSRTLRPAWSRSRPRRPFAPKAPTVSLPPPPLRLLPAGATQLPGGTLTRKISAPFHGALRRGSDSGSFRHLSESKRHAG